MSWYSWNYELDDNFYRRHAWVSLHPTSLDLVVHLILLKNLDMSAL